MAAAGMAATAVAGRFGITTGAGGSKGGKLLGQFLRVAMRTFGVFPVSGADKDFAVVPAFLAMEFVNRHETNYFRR